MDFNRYITTAVFHELAELLRTEGRLVAFAPGEPFARQDERNRHCGLVEEGAFRYVHLTSRGESHVVGYAFAGEFVGDYISMSSGRPSWVGIEAICESRVWTLERDTLEAFYAVDAAHERLGRLFAEHLLSEVYERLLQSYVTSPQDLYEILLRRCPNLLNFISLKELASFLRIRPETLSRIRRRIL